MKTIPEDIMKAAMEVFAAKSPSMDRRIFDGLYATIRSQAINAIAQAILAERERCAREPVSVPEGWQLVPKEPTETMLDAFWDQTGESREMRSRVHSRARRYYVAILAAAPALTPAEKAGVGDGERDLPTEFEAWWETSAFHQARCDGYSHRKQLAWDAYYAASIRALSTTKPAQGDGEAVADQIIGQIEDRFPNWRSYRDLIDCIDCTLHELRKGSRS